MVKSYPMLYKTLVVGVIVLFIGMSVTPSIGISNNDDTTPPVTTCTLDPPEPDGLNGWYVSDVNVTLNATDDISGVNAIYYRINDEEWETYESPFVISEDGDDILIEYYSVDNVGNIEDVKLVVVKIDQTEPNIYLTYEIIGGSHQTGWDFLFTATATDDMSGMERVEFYLNDELKETVYGPGPDYDWCYRYLPNSLFQVIGFIRNLEITDEYVKFYAIIVIISGPWQQTILVYACAYDKAGNSACDKILPSPPLTIKPGIYLFQNLTLPNNYDGYIGRFLIFATFDIS